MNKFKLSAVLLTMGITLFSYNPSAHAGLQKIELNSLSSHGQEIPSYVQQRLLVILESKDAAAVTQQEAMDKFVEALSSGEDAPSKEITQRLVKQIHGLLKHHNRIEFKKLMEANNSFNDLINHSGLKYLQNPPQEMLAIRAAMFPMINAVLQ